MNKALERFLRYAVMDTSSDEHAGKTPSSQGQWALAKMLYDELIEIGAQQVTLDESCYVYGFIPSNTEDQPTIALIAHLDTADAVPGRVFKPRVAQFEGEDLILNQESGVCLSAKDFPALNDFIGQELIVTDGTTVLGSDDKAGIAEIMTALEMIIARPEIKHGGIWAVFTPDEEIGSGAELLNLDLIKADFGYTLDGGSLDEIEFENFNAASAKVVVQGRNVHPGYAKGKMVNAIKLAMQFHSLLPAKETPEMIEGYEGFYHLRRFSGTEERADLDYIIRDHDHERFLARKAVMAKAIDTLNASYGEDRFILSLADSYSNMKDIVIKVPHVLRRAEKALRACGMEPKAVPIRGGTDGARLSFRGLPCPNLGTGGMNWHSVYEFLPVESLNRMTEVIVEIVRA